MLRGSLRANDWHLSDMHCLLFREHCTMMAVSEYQSEMLVAVPKHTQYTQELLLPPNHKTHLYPAAT